MKLIALPTAVLVMLLAAGCSSTSANPSDDSSAPASTAPANKEVETATSSADAVATDATAPPLKVGAISWDTEFAIECGEMNSSGFTDQDTVVEVGTVGAAWDYVAKDSTCYGVVQEGAENEAETYTFAWEKETDDAGYFIPRPQYHEVLEYFVDDLDKRDKIQGFAEKTMRFVVYNCVTHYEDGGMGEEYREAIAEYAASAVLCPGHPQREEWVSAVDSVPDLAARLKPYQAQMETVAQQQLAAKEKSDVKKEAADKAAAEKKAAQEKADREKATAEAKNHARDGGHYLIGKSLNPGLYRTDSNMITNCYWEIADATGNIIDNNFISTAPQFELYIPATAAGFTISGCSMTRIGD